MLLHPQTKQANQLLHEGILAFADFEMNGLRIDLKHCKKWDKKITKKIKKLTTKIYKSKEIKVWKKVYKSDFNMDSNKQLGTVLFEHLGYKPEIYTTEEKTTPSVSEAALQAANIPIANQLLELRKIQKLQNTYLGNIIKETIDGYIHPIFNLHTVSTFRSSSNSINFQNQPKRDPKAKKMIRSAFIPREGHCLGGLDYSGVEVRISCCVHKDPNLIADVIDPKKDMHRDMAIECFMLDENEWTKQARNTAKNKFVFPEFYGNWFKACARDLWNDIELYGLVTKNGTPLYEHLKKQGIKNLSQYTDYIEDVEDRFWNVRYPVFNEWKEKVWHDYQKTGYVDLITGFRCREKMKKNEVLNRPIQGPAFHCLVWSAIEANRIAKKEKWKTKLVGQIHDELTVDFNGKEMSYVLDTASRIMTKDIREAFPWIIIPLEVEAEVTPLNSPWPTAKGVTRSGKCKCGNRWWHVELLENSFTKWICPVCGNSECK